MCLLTPLASTSPVPPVSLSGNPGTELARSYSNENDDSDEPRRSVSDDYTRRRVEFAWRSDPPTAGLAECMCEPRVREAVPPEIRYRIPMVFGPGGYT